MKQRLFYTLSCLLVTLPALAQTTYAYDKLNRLTKVVFPNGTFVTYTYDQLGNRKRKQVSATGQVDEPDPEADLADGIYYLRNVTTGKFWGADNKWGTQASLVDEHVYVTLARLNDGRYTMESLVSNGGTDYYLGANLFMDSQPASVTITPKGEYYTFAIDEGSYIGYDGTSSVLTNSLTADSENALWEVISEQDMLAEEQATLAAATVESPVDATFLIKDPGFGRNRRDAWSAWTISNTWNYNIGGGADETHPNACAESWHSTFDLSQVIAEAPKGVYKLTAQGFFRQDGSDYDHLPYFYINDATTEFPERTGTEESMTAAGESFRQGLYEAEPMYIELTDAGTLTVGARLENNTTLWAIWDNFRLTYYGSEATLSDVMPSTIPGDVNGDGRLSVVDVTALMNIILCKTDNINGQLRIGNADVDGDGSVTNADVTVLVNIILGKIVP